MSSSQRVKSVRAVHFSRSRFVVFKQAKETRSIATLEKPFIRMNVCFNVKRKEIIVDLAGEEEN